MQYWCLFTYSPCNFILYSWKHLSLSVLHDAVPKMCVIAQERDVMELVPVPYM